MKSQKGEKEKRMKHRPISMEGFNVHESRWRLLVFEVPNIHWRRIQVQMEVLQVLQIKYGCVQALCMLLVD